MVLVSTLVSPGQGCAMITIPQMFSREMWAASCQSPRGLSFSGVIVFYIALPRWPKKGVTCQRSSTITLVVQIMKPRMEIEFFWLHAFDIEAGSQNIKNFSRERIFQLTQNKWGTNHSVSKWFRTSFQPDTTVQKFLIHLTPQNNNNSDNNNHSYNHRVST